MKMQEHSTTQRPPNVILADSLRPNDNQYLLINNIINFPSSPQNSCFYIPFVLTHHLSGVYAPAHNDVIS
jgi:hypothetical protein